MSTRKNTLYNISYRVFSVLLPLVTAPYLSRAVGRAGVGLYSYTWNISYFMCLVGMLGLENYGVRAIASARDHQETLNRTFSGIWRMQRSVALTALAAWLIYVFCIAGEEKDIALALTPMSVACLCNLDWCLMGLDTFRPIALRNTAVKLIAAACVFLFVKGPQDLWIYGMAWSAATLVGCLLSAVSLRGRVSIVRVNAREAFRHLGPCALLFLSVLAVSVYRTMDKVMVGAIAGMEQNGLYENAEKIIYCLSGFISAVGTVMLPKASHLQKLGETGKIRQHLDLTMRAMMCMVSAMAFGVAAVADRLCPLFYGEDFAASAPLMSPLGFTLVFIGFANVIRTQWVLPQNRDTIVLRSVLSGAVVNLAANLILIPRMKAMGAVVGTLLAEFTVPFVQWLCLRRELPYARLLTYVVQYTLAGAVMLLTVRAAAALLPVTWPALLLEIGIGAAVYGLICLVLWKLTGDRRMLSLLRFKRSKS